MDLPAVVQEKLIELDDENNQLKIEVQRLNAKLSSRDEILNELEEENLQLRTRAKQVHTGDPRITALQQRIADQEATERLQEEKDDAIFELQRATHRIAALETERDDCTERAEAASLEARDMARHNKELREKLHELEAELMASRANASIANRGNSMFAEFAEERVRLEADLKLLYCKYSALRKENSQLANELDEARLLALRRGRKEESHKCRCEQVIPELLELRARLRLADDRLASARRDLMDAATRTAGIDPLLKSSYKSLKLEMESLRQERDKLRDERDKLFDENASLAARAANAETLMGYANDDVETLKIQLAMFRERQQKQDAERVSNSVNGGSGDMEANVCSVIPPSLSAPLSIKEQAQTPGQQSCCEKTLKSYTPSASIRTPLGATLGPRFQKDEQNSFCDNSFTVVLDSMSEVRPKRIKFLDEQNEEEDALRRNSVSASELRRLQRKQARRGKSKVLPVYDTSEKVVVNVSEQPSRPSVVCNVSGDEHPSCPNLPSSSGDRSSCSTEVGLLDRVASSVLPISTLQADDGSESLLPLSENTKSNMQMHSGGHSHSILNSTRDFNKTLLEDVIEEKENDSSCKSSQDI
ncbi:hypothetical protein GCK32_007097 [Trichostrongylus colubriformis]|uniref:Uncharacterized protein n=1 Tax=Trichostrongylus colubriformis TaxID=6319 RepID=A0AAN8J284_TRICO